MRERAHGLFGLDAMKGQAVRCQRTVPQAGDLACLAAEMRPDEWQRLNRIGTRANAAVLSGHDDIDEVRTGPHYPGGLRESEPGSNLSGFSPASSWPRPVARPHPPPGAGRGILGVPVVAGLPGGGGRN